MRVPSSREPRGQIETRTDRQRLRLIRTQHQESTSAVCQNRQILLYYDEGGHGGVVHLAAALVVVDAEGVGIPRTVWFAVQCAAFPVGCLHGDAAREVRAGGHFDLAGVREALCRSS